ncbi:hypothetical protein VNO78_18353 [Psophocarpus tetragonolobus]|uniref:Uncharacterized protein n=1 Tax=Psophocarpus tetragonolobus TaxID=3891 RepID=A0AAN9SIM4_PSOTE
MSIHIDMYLHVFEEASFTHIHCSHGHREVSAHFQKRTILTNGQSMQAYSVETLDKLNEQFFFMHRNTVRGLNEPTTKRILMPLVMHSSWGSKSQIVNEQPSYVVCDLEHVLSKEMLDNDLETKGLVEVAIEYTYNKK